MMPSKDSSHKNAVCKYTYVCLLHSVNNKPKHCFRLNPKHTDRHRLLSTLRDFIYFSRLQQICIQRRFTSRKNINFSMLLNEERNISILLKTNNETKKKTQIANIVFALTGQVSKNSIFIHVWQYQMYFIFLHYYKTCKNVWDMLQNLQHVPYSDCFIIDCAANMEREINNNKIKQ